jgi:hypothetical protein
MNDYADKASNNLTDLPADLPAVGTVKTRLETWEMRESRQPAGTGSSKAEVSAALKAVTKQQLMKTVD